MKHVASAALASFVPMASVCLAGCASLSGDGSEKPVVPRAHALTTALQPSMGYYENAVDAIYARHYALALEYLQAARAQKPDDVRVLTAFGVVYDKMGRFDLSARYYAQAAALDPHSTIVAHDVEYSRALQGFISGPAPVLAQAAPSGLGVGASASSEVSMPPPVAAILPDEKPQDTAGKLAATPIPKQAVLARDIDQTWTQNRSIRAPVPVLANTAPSGLMPRLPALPEVAAAEPVTASPLSSNIPVATPIRDKVIPNPASAPFRNGSASPLSVTTPAPTPAAVELSSNNSFTLPPRLVVAVRKIDYSKAFQARIVAPTPVLPEVPAPVSVTTPASKPAAVELSNNNSFTLPPRLVVAVRKIDYSKVFQARIVAPTPVLPEVPAPVGAGKMPVVPNLAMPRGGAIHLTMANAGTVRPFAIAASDRITYATKAPGNIKATTPATGKRVSLTGHPLILINAAGRRDAGKVVSAYLSGRGWSVAKDIPSLPKVQSQTAIYYPTSMIMIAKGLTNTLSLHARLIASPIQMGLKLVLGRDAAGPVSVERLTRAQYRRVANSVSKIRSSE